MRKKTVRNLEPRYQYMMDNAYCHICPPASGSIHRRKKPELEAFLDFVLCQGLSKQTLQRADEAMRMINFEDSEVSHLLQISSSPNLPSNFDVTLSLVLFCTIEIQASH